MKRIFEIKPSGIAAYLHVQELGHNPQFNHAVVYLLKEKGVVYGPKEQSINDSDLPLKVIASINKHFGFVFSLEHENWEEKGPSPRARYCDNLLPWVVETNE